VRAIALSWLKEGLKPRCITRNLEWGIKVPLKNYTNLVFYVWFDAPIAYISMTSECRSDWKKWWTNSEIYHFLGKDNIPFHTIFWPGILMAARSKATNFALPHYVAGYEFLNWEGKKFSTSRHVGIFSDEALELFPADYWRYYLSAILPEKKDSNFEWEDFQNRINNELLANYGNVFYRITSFIEKHFGKVPRIYKPGKPEADLERQLARALERTEKFVRKVRLKDALKEVMAFSDALNRYFQAKEPWFAIRNKATKRDAGTTLYYAVNALAAVTAMLWPFVPATAEVALKCLGVKREKLEWSKLNGFNIKAGAKIRSLILFERVEDDEIAAAKERPKGEILHKA
jgi:methionyl-tRNA synthetase